MGGNIEGVEEASQRYFGKSAKYLTNTEAALLVVLPQRPTVYRPDRNPNNAFNARNKVLNRLHIGGLINKQKLAFYQKESIPQKRQSIIAKAPLLARKLKQENQNSAYINTTIVNNIQTDLDNLLNNRVQVLNSHLSSAVMIMDNSTGNVLGYRGSADFFDNKRFGHVDMNNAVRSPGSTLKPFIYAMAMDKGLIHSKSLLTDVPMRFGDYRPKNFDLRFDGAVSMDVSLKLSKMYPWY